MLAVNIYYQISSIFFAIIGIKGVQNYSEKIEMKGIFV